MKKFKIILFTFVIAALTFGVFVHQGAKSIAEDLPYLDGYNGKQATVNY